MSIVYIIPGEPIPWTRVQYNRSSHKFFDAQKQMKLVAGISIKSCHGNAEPYVGPLHLDVSFYFNLKGKNIKQRPFYNSFKPDLDNLIKFILDTMNDCENIYNDDCLVTKITAQKIYGPVARTEFTLTELK